jgi:hypothetical protein
MQRYFGDMKAAVRSTTHLFFSPHQAVLSSELSRSLSYHTHQLLGIKISIPLWHHIVTWFLNVTSQSDRSSRLRYHLLTDLFLLFIFLTFPYSTNPSTGLRSPSRPYYPSIVLLTYYLLTSYPSYFVTPDSLCPSSPSPDSDLVR